MKKVLRFFFTSLERCDSGFLFTFLIAETYAMCSICKQKWALLR